MKKNFVTIGIVLAIVIGGFLIFANRGNGVFSGPHATLKIEIPVNGVDVIVDNAVVGKSRPAGEAFSTNVSLGNHTVIVTKNTFWPWSKKIIAEKGQIISFKPFLITQNVSGSVITASDPEYNGLFQRVSNSALPRLKPDAPAKKTNESLKDWLDKNVLNKKVSNDGTIALWVNNNSVFAAWIGPDDKIDNPIFCTPECNPVTEVLPSQAVIRNVEFYKDRNDLMVISTGNSIFIVELDRRDTQNFQPLYTGTLPTFYKPENPNTIIVKDAVQGGTVLMEIAL
ncbi:hypothetical protein KW783_01645 [Candidatus Parcubacteria bacterium]|nr:hypothetical protein [Candidatus Parcubacteria bacterium]